MNALTIIPTPGTTTAMIDRPQLDRALAAALRIVDPRSTIPVLREVALVADGADRLILRATDLDIEAEIAVDAMAIDPRFAVTLNAKQLADLVRKAPASDGVTLTAPVPPAGATEDETADTTPLVTVRVGGVEAVLPGHWATCLPSMPELREKRHRFAMSGSTLWSALDDVRTAVSVDATRHALNGVFMHRPEGGAGDNLVFVATDGHRLMRRAVEAPDGARDMAPVIIPTNAVELLHGLLRGRACPARVDLAVGAARVEVSFSGMTIEVKTVDGTFPDYQRVIPMAADKRACFSSPAVVNALRSLVAVAEEGGRAVHLAFEDEHCRLSITSPGTGTASVFVPCQYEGEPMEIGFNAQLMLDAIVTACPAGEPFHMALNEAGSPAVFRGTSQRFIGVLMPMRV